HRARPPASVVLAGPPPPAAGEARAPAYSGGMRRRLDLGASLAGRPRLLLLDEPTTGLDPRTRLELWDFLRDLVATGTTVLLTTQYLEEADALADRITVIDRGSVIAEGTARDLKTSIGSSHLVVAPDDPDDLTRTADILDRLFRTTVRIDHEQRSIVAADHDRVDDLVVAAAALRDAGVDVSDIGIHRPTLDDVFLTITGRRT
ncbi:MAG: AAA family ATPase, partial [Actinomycetota bacterium]